MGAVFAVTFGTVGALVASRRSTNPIGWIFLASGLCAALQELGPNYALIAYRGAGASLHAAAYGAWLGEWLWIPYTGGILVFVFLLFPEGRLPGRRWRVVAVMGLVGMVLAFAGAALPSGPMFNFRSVDNPVALLSRHLSGVLVTLGFALFALAGLLAVVGLVPRFRKSRGGGTATVQMAARSRAVHRDSPAGQRRRARAFSTTAESPRGLLWLSASVAASCAPFPCGVERGSPRGAPLVCLHVRYWYCYGSRTR